MTEETGNTPGIEEVMHAYAEYTRQNGKFYAGEVKSFEELDSEFDRFANSLRAEGFIAAQNTMQESMGEAMRDYAERVWAQCSAWHAEQGMGVEGAEDKHNPHTLENRDKLLKEYGLR